ncbi:hypothetical protein W97_07145 [Coniosporium apollinis CBS 100218]|uniref:HNH nuclease domain-containing protein n=1 Tax=Coniosporium apollinis (strain CBS 100218) TaxID=1168221 RepID=R7Z1M8_CONA1|nr:uncharacterized protein W97_07145 [Coniosporium apollinis CBS 100218]EON67998.1 hypothetical protein W97_07145 [Coniosporium apollinis CBS 100218]
MVGNPASGYIDWRAIHKDPELQFCGSNRPALRYLHFHFVTSVLRRHRYRREGWQKDIVRHAAGPFWAIGQIEDMEQFFGRVLQQMPLTPEGKALKSADEDIGDGEVTAHLDMEPGEMEDEEEQED